MIPLLAIERRLIMFLLLLHLLYPREYISYLRYRMDINEVTQGPESAWRNIQWPLCFGASPYRWR